MDQTSASAAAAQRYGARERELSAAMLVVADLRVIALLLNQVRYGTCERAFGLQPDQVNVVTAVAALSLTAAARERLQGAWRPPAAPTAHGLSLGAAAGRMLITTLLGPSSESAAMIGLLAVVAVTDRLLPVAGRAARGIARSPRRLRRALARQSQWLIERASEAGQPSLTPE